MRPWRFSWSMRRFVPLSPGCSIDTRAAWHGWLRFVPQFMFAVGSKTAVAQGISARGSERRELPVMAGYNFGVTPVSQDPHRTYWHALQGLILTNSSLSQQACSFDLQNCLCNKWC